MIIELEEHRLTHAVQAELTLVQGSKFWPSLPAVGQVPQVSSVYIKVISVPKPRVPLSSNAVTQPVATFPITRINMQKQARPHWNITNSGVSLTANCNNMAGQTSVEGKQVLFATEAELFIEQLKTYPLKEIGSAK